jgi:hypothetical protein
MEGAKDMGNYLNLGNDGFTSIRKGTYVDKTGLISFINNTLGTAQKLTCVSRPRRFGKSFAAKMLCAYYDRSCDSRKLFEDLEIAKDPSFEEHLNKYDVIYLDMTWFITDRESIKQVVKNLQKDVIRELVSAYPEVEPESTLPKMLSRIVDATGRKFIFIVDEWDALFREAAQDTELQEEYIQLLRNLFKSGVTDKMIAGAYMTGILPIKKYGTQSAMTDFMEYTMLSPMGLAEYVGFTESEVRALCEQYHVDFEEMKRWYDGYAFRKIKSVYNPNSVMRAITSGEFASYWTRTETYEALKIYIDMDFDGLKESVVQMLGGMRCHIDTGAFQNDMTSIKSKDDVLTLLVHLGYLAYDMESESVHIPNEEIRREFIRAVKAGKHKELVRLIRNSDQLLEATLDMDGEAVGEIIEEAHNAGCAPIFYNNEQALRSVIRFAYISSVDEFLRVEELPSGRGYADVVYIPKKGSSMPIMVVELKWNKPVESAIDQIKNRNYPQALGDYGSDILLVGVSYDDKTKKHSCRIEKFSR